MPFVNERDNLQTIDYKRNATLKFIGKTGGSSQNIDCYELVWNGHVINFHTSLDHESHSVGDTKIFTLVHNINFLKIPEALKDKKSEILRLIQEALEEYGISYQNQNIKEIKVNYAPGLGVA